jgi:hypothetical protein
MERYRSNHVGDHSSQSFTELSGTNTMRKDPPSPNGAAHDAQEEVTGSERPDMSAAGSPHNLAIPMRTLRRLTNEEDNFNMSESSRNLLSGVDSDIDAPNTENGDLDTTNTHSVSNFIRRLPWLVFLSFLGNLTCTALAVFILLVSNHTTQASWSIQPSVYLAALA